MSIKNKVNTRKAMALAAVFAFAMILLVACGGQQGSAGSMQGDGAASPVISGGSPVSDSTTATTGFGDLEEKPIRVATTEEDYQILDGGSYADLYVTKNMQQRLPTGNKIIVKSSAVFSEYGFYEVDRFGKTVRNLYYPISGLPILKNLGCLIGSYGDVPVCELDRQVDMITARDSSSGNITAYKCKLVGCTIGWVNDESAIWNQNDLIPVSNPDSLQLVDLNGQPRPNPMDWEFGEELIAECDGRSYQVRADSYVYSVDSAKIEITGKDVKVKYDGGLSDVFFGYDYSKLEPGLYYFQDLGVYKIV